MSLCCKCGVGLWYQPLKITKWNHISRVLNGPGTKSRLFEGPKTFLALLNGTSDSEGHFGGQMVNFSTIILGRESWKSTLFWKVWNVLYSDIIIVNVDRWPGPSMLIGTSGRRRQGPFIYAVLSLSSVSLSNSPSHASTSFGPIIMSYTISNIGAARARLL